MLPDCERSPIPPFRRFAKTDDVAGPVGVEDARGVRPDDANAVGPGDIDHLLLKLAALFAGLGEAAGENDGALDALGSATRDDLGERLRRCADENEIHGPGHVGDVRIAAQPKYFRLLRIERVDLAGIAILDELLDRAKAALGLFLRSADHGDRVGIENLRE